MVLSNDVLHFIDSTFSSPTAKELMEILEDESNCERDSLIRLIISPDESMQISIEEMLIDEAVEESYLANVIDLLCAKKLKLQIVFPDGRGRLPLTVPDEGIASFVSQLNMDWNPDARILAMFDRMVHTHLTKQSYPDQRKRADHIRAAVTVRMRNKRIDYSEKKIGLLCTFLEHSDMEDDYFLKSFTFLLDILDGLNDGEDLYNAFLLRKEQYCQCIRKKESFDSLLQKSNVETLALQGNSAPFINQDDLKKRIEFMDRISLAVYGKIVYC